MRKIILAIIFFSTSLISLHSQVFEKTLNAEIESILNPENAKLIKQLTLVFKNGYIKVKERKVLANDHLVFNYEIPLDEIQSLSIKNNKLLLKSQNVKEGFRTVIRDGNQETISMQHEVIIQLSENDNQKLFNCLDKGIKFQESLRNDQTIVEEETVVARDSIITNQTEALYGYMLNKLDHSILLNGSSKIEASMRSFLNLEFLKHIKNCQITFILSQEGMVEDLKIQSPILKNSKIDVATLEKEISDELNEQQWSIGYLNEQPVVSLLVCSFDI
jgi:hypothetical protein